MAGTIEKFNEQVGRIEDLIAAVKAMGFDDGDVTFEGVTKASLQKRFQELLDAALLTTGMWQTTAQGVGQGVAGTTSLVAGSGGANGTFSLGFSGGTQVIAPEGYFVVAAGVVSEVVITYAGHYSSGTPTLSFVSSAGLVGASATVVMAANTPLGKFFIVPSSEEHEYVILYKNNAGVAQEQGRFPSSQAAIDALAAAATAIEQAGLAEASAAIAASAVSGSVNTFFAATKSAGDALAASLGDGATVITNEDEAATPAGVQTRRTVSGGVLSAIVSFLKTGMIAWKHGGIGAVWRTLYSRLMDLDIIPEDFSDGSDTPSSNLIALQAAYNECASRGRKLRLIRMYDIEGTFNASNNVDIIGIGEENCGIRSIATDGSDAVKLSDTTFLRGLRWSGFAIISGATAGHCVNIAYGLVRCKFDFKLSALNPNKSVINGNFVVGVTGGVYDCKFSGGEYRITTAHNVPGVKLVANGTLVNTNKFQPQRTYNGLGAQFYWLECTSATNWFLTNRFDHLECEISNGGILALFGCKDTQINYPVLWDLSASNGGVMANDGILLSKSGAGRECRNTQINGYNRTAGTLAAGKYDINLDDARETVFINCGNPSSSPTYDINFGGEGYVWIGQMGQVTETNASSILSTRITNLSIRTPKKTMPRNGYVLTINGGAISNPAIDFFAVDSEGGAAIDYLDTIPISDADDGRIIVMRSNSASRTIVARDGTGNLSLQSDRTLDHNRDRLMLQGDAALALWVELSFSDNQ